MRITYHYSYHSLHYHRKCTEKCSAI